VLLFSVVDEVIYTPLYGVFLVLKPGRVVIVIVFDLVVVFVNVAIVMLVARPVFFIFLFLFTILSDRSYSGVLTRGRGTYDVYF